MVRFGGLTVALTVRTSRLGYFDVEMSDRTWLGYDQHSQQFVTKR